MIESDGSFAYKLTCHPNKDVGALIASGSYLHDGMVVVPCSSTSLGTFATGSGSNLLTGPRWSRSRNAASSSSATASRP